MTKRILAFVGLGAYLVVSVNLLRLDDPIADWLVSEDGLFEVLGAVALLVGSTFTFLALLRLRSRGGASLLKLLSYAGVGLLLFVAAGEELSWGQRLLGIETPESVRRINAQGEITLHNLYGDENGQNASSLIFQAFWVGFGVLLPLLAIWKPLGNVLRRYLPVIPVWLALLFIGQQLLWQPVKAVWRSDPSAWNSGYRGKIGEEPFRVDSRAEAEARGVSVPGGLSEVMEANIQVLLAAAGISLYLGAGRRLSQAGAIGSGKTSGVAARVAGSPSS